MDEVGGVVIDVMEFWVKRLFFFKYCDWMGECFIYRSICEMFLFLLFFVKVMYILWNVFFFGGGRC